MQRLARLPLSSQHPEVIDLFNRFEEIKQIFQKSLLPSTLQLLATPVVKGDMVEWYTDLQGQPVPVEDKNITPLVRQKIEGRIEMIRDFSASLLQKRELPAHQLAIVQKLMSVLDRKAYQVYLINNEPVLLAFNPSHSIISSPKATPTAATTATAAEGGTTKKSLWWLWLLLLLLLLLPLLWWYLCRINPQPWICDKICLREPIFQFGVKDVIPKVPLLNDSKMGAEPAQDVVKPAVEVGAASQQSSKPESKVDPEFQQFKDELLKLEEELSPEILAMQEEFSRQLKSMSPEEHQQFKEKLLKLKSIPDAELQQLQKNFLEFQKELQTLEEGMTTELQSLQKELIEPASKTELVQPVPALVKPVPEPVKPVPEPAKLTPKEQWQVPEQFKAEPNPQANQTQASQPQVPKTEVKPPVSQPQALKFEAKPQSPPKTKDVVCQEVPEPGQEPEMVIIFDNSGSMFERLDVAKNATLSVIDKINRNVDIGFVALSYCPSDNLGQYGYSDRKVLKNIVEKLYPDTYSETGALTALYDGIQNAAEMVDGVHREAFILVVSDGHDTCNQESSVCELAEQIAQKKPKLKINVVDIGDTKAASCVATATGGRVFTANNASEIASLVQKAAQPMMGKKCF